MSAYDHGSISRTSTLSKCTEKAIAVGIAWDKIFSPKQHDFVPENLQQLTC